MDSQTTCQNCKKDFIIFSRDKEFYEKIQVPEPTFCPECRMIRRMAWRNVRSLFPRKCGLCAKDIISMYKDDGVLVYCTTCFSGDGWDPQSYGADIDFTKTFFEQYKTLLYTVPRHYKYSSGNLINSEYTNYSIDNKDNYLAYSTVRNEEVYYSEYIEDSKNSFDCWNVQKMDNCSYCVDSSTSFNCHYIIESHNCMDSFFTYDCTNCSNCTLSWNQRNQNYLIFNQKYTKEEYIEKVKELKLDTYEGLETAKKIFFEKIEMEAIHRYAQILQSQNVTGDQIIGSNNVHFVFDTQNSENIFYGNRVITAKDSMDITGTGFNVELAYETMAGSINGSNNHFVYITLNSQNCEYTFGMRNCHDCFGCVGMNNASYCIFNKQYTKEEYLEFIPKIKKHMTDKPYIDSKGRVYKYGEYFPFEFSPFGYNETNVSYFFPLSKSEAQQKGYNYFDRPKRNYQISVRNKDLLSSIFDVSENILKETIECPNEEDQKTECTGAFKIHPQELLFLKNKGLPLPRYCPNCRHYERISHKNPLQLSLRICSNNCTREFQSTYALDRKEKVFCEECYKQAVL